MSINILTLRIQYEQDIVFSRQRARQISELIGFDLREQTSIATAVSEITRNAFSYAGKSDVYFLFDDKSSPPMFIIKVSDHGPGIKDVDSILSGRYSSKTGLGMGIVGSRRLMDYFKIESAPGLGTTVILGKILPKERKLDLKEEAARISKELVKKNPQDLYEEMRQQNQELLRSLDEIKKRQEDLVSLNKELEETNRGVVALYAELDERAEHLKTINEIKTKFLSNMSHEFKTPLNSILALSNLLIQEADGKLNDEQEKQVKYIRKSTEDLYELVNDLLDIAKVEAGKLTVKPSSFSIEQLFSTLKVMFKPLIITQTVNLVFQEPKGLPNLYTDEIKVSQILRNLISNAIKFTENGEIRITSQYEDNTERIIFSVKDTGIGIEEKYKTIIFEEFAQIDSDLQRKAKGTGLGLPLSKRLAELLGGSLWVDSIYGKGSVFYLNIPIIYKGPGSGTLQESSIFSKGDRSSEAGKFSEHNILIIDDQEISRYILQGVLNDLFPDYSVIQAKDGKDGLEKTEVIRPEVIFLDLIMPGLNGFDVLEKLKGNSYTSNIPVYIVTSKDLSAKDKDRLGNGPAGIISKNILSSSNALETLRVLIRI
ncbi:MAG: ATP-binding protein [Bacteroidota bacterium]|nr:ATP-binding protein [Bacteroidota bacterium]MDP4190560.1 ATP-binding protein [Bacteroidota bacterium]MDP4194220.1 ATP-binding protein [Bacteroidota bacterium]